MTDYPVNHHPFWLDAISIVLLLQNGILRVFCPPLFTFPRILLSPRAVVQTWRLVHVRFPLVVPEHHRVEDLELRKDRWIREKSVHPVTSHTSASLSHL